MRDVFMILLGVLIGTDIVLVYACHRLEEKTWKR